MLRTADGKYFENNGDLGNARPVRNAAKQLLQLLDACLAQLPGIVICWVSTHPSQIAAGSRVIYLLSLPMTSHTLAFCYAEISYQTTYTTI